MSGSYRDRNEDRTEMKDIHAEKTEYQAVIHTAPSLFRRSCRVMAGFLRDNGLDPERGMTLLIGEELPEQAKNDLEIIPLKTMDDVILHVFDGTEPKMKTVVRKKVSKEKAV